MASGNSLLGTSPRSPRKRQPSPSRSYSSGSDHADYGNNKRRRHDDLAVEVCKDFIRNACRRVETECKFAHPHSSVAIERDKVIACADSLRSKCFRGRNCRYFHPPPQIQELLLKAIGVEDTKVPMICRDFIRGRCLRAATECRFAHHSSIDECAIVCQDFIRGRCERKSCRYSHTLVHSVPQALQYHGASIVLSSYPQPGNDHETIPVCRDFLKNACNRDSCKYAHPDSHAKVHLQYQGLPVNLNGSTLPEIPNAILSYQDVVPVCKDFLKNACKRDSCKYFHLIPQTEAYLQPDGTLVNLPISPHSGAEQENLPVCKDFLKNDCQRDSCKYAHPNLQTKVVDNQVEICRDFRRGICHRTTCCFYHPRARSAKKQETQQNRSSSIIIL